MPTPLLNLAQDLNRSLLHGARRVNGQGETVPSTVIDGRQAAADPLIIEAGVEVLLEGSLGAVIKPEAGSVTSAVNAATRALRAPDTFFHLDEERQIPTWIYHRKLFSLPDRPLVEDEVELEKDVKKLLRLPAAILHEADKHRLAPTDDGTPAPPPISLCRVKTEMTASKASYQSLDPLPREEWQPALLLRCPLNPAWEATDASAVPVFELEGIPQSQRWYLDRLGLMKGSPETPITKKDLKLWIESPRAEGDTAPVERHDVEEWVIARRNLTGLARPGQVADSGKEAKLVLPYAATQKATEDTLRLLQMASITNAGGYYLQPHDNNASFTAQKHTLVIAVLLPTVAGPGESTAWLLHAAANAVVFPADPKPAEGEKPKASVEPSVVRFEGVQHVVVEPYAPQGCLAFGWRRPLPLLTDEKDNHPGTAEGFARSIHLLDYEIHRISAAGAKLCQEWQERIIWEQGVRRSDWHQESCSGDLGPALSPVQPLAGQSEDNSRRRILPLDAVPAAPAPHTGPNPPPDKRHNYRSTIRFAREEEGFNYLADPANRTFLISAGFRDIFGNRLLSNLGQQKRELFYTDALVAPVEWPGFAFSLHPLAGGKVALQCRYRAPEAASSDPRNPSLDPADVMRKLARIRAQVEGATGDLAISLEDGQQENPVFSFQAGGTAASLKESLLTFLKEVTAGKTPKPLVLEFTVNGKLGLSPVLFNPVLKLKRTQTDLHPNDDSLPDDAWLKKAVKSQVIEAASPITLAKDGTEPQEGSAIPAFTEVARTFAEHFEAPFSTQIALRRNRFNEHELWFVPNQVFPVVSAGAPIFSSPRPLKNSLGADSFLVPSFTQRNDPPAGTWNQFNLPLYSTSVSGIDHDLLGRRVFNLLEDLSQPAEITGKAAGEGDQPLWNGILAAKDRLANTLGDSGNDFVVAVDTQAPGSPSGIDRMCKDAFQRDLRLYYGVDTLVQWPLGFASGASKITGITNYYGRSTATFNRAGPPLPKYSDFVLSLAKDSNPGLLTVTYDLPPGDESTTDWLTKSFHASLTHIQLSAGPDDDNHPFNPGQWLELVPAKEPDTSTPSITRLDYTNTSGIAVPAADRRFPKEPILNAALTVPATRAAGSLDWLGKWGWQVVFDAEGGLSDNVFLDVEYDLAEEAGGNPNDDAAGDADWKPLNLLHALVVLDSLTRFPAPWWGSDEGIKAKSTLPFLLASLDGHLKPKPGDAPQEAPSKMDRFVIPLKTASGTPIQGDPKQLVKQVIPHVAAAGAMKRYTIDAAPGFPLDLASAARTRNFRPSLKLRRNDQLAGKNTNPLLIYECGPVIFHSVVRAANRQREPLFVEPDTLTTLSGVLERALGEILGSATDLRTISIRLDCRHAFKIGTVRLENPFAIFPVDFPHADVATTAGLIVSRYREWLGGGDLPPRLAAMTDPEFVIGLQMSERAHPRILLEVDSLCFKLDGLSI